MRRRYDLFLFCVAAFVWALVLSAILAQPLWRDLLDLLRSQGWNAESRETLLGAVILLVFGLSTVGVFIHLSVCFLPVLRKRYHPAWLSHIACFGLLWLASGGAWIVLTRPFPYLARA